MGKQGLHDSCKTDSTHYSGETRLGREDKLPTSEKKGMDKITCWGPLATGLVQDQVGCMHKPGR